MITNSATDINAVSASIASFTNQQNAPAPKVYPMNRGSFDRMIFKYGNQPRKATLEKSTTDNAAKGLPSSDTLLPTLSPAEAEEWLSLKEYDLPSKDLFATIDPEVLESLEDEDNGAKKPAAIEKTDSTKTPAAVDKPIATAMSKTTEPTEDADTSQVMQNLYASFAMLSREEQQKLLHQITPSTAGHPTASFLSNTGNSHFTPWRTPTNDIAFTSNISDISMISTGPGYILQQPTLQVDAHQSEHTAISNYQASPSSYTDPNVDPLEAIMSSSRLTIYKELIKDLASSSTAATNALQQKTLAAEKLHDPLINPTPRSIRNNQFTLTTIAEFRDHEYFKTLQMKAAGYCEQYKANLTATIRELTTNEITWLKILRVQRIVQKLKPIIASLVFKLDHITIRPSLPELVTQDTIHFFMFYWLIQLNSKTNQRCYSTFFGLPINDIAATAAPILIENNPLAIGKIVENLNQESMNWDTKNQATGYFVTTILRDLDAIINAAVFDYVTYDQAQKNAKTVDAQVQAYVNKLRVKNTTVLTNETLARVEKQVKTDNINEQDMRRRQQELETIVAKQNERINHFVKEQQKNSQKNSHGSYSAQRPSQLKPILQQIPTKHVPLPFTPAQTGQVAAIATTSAQQALAKTEAKPATGTTNQKRQKKKRKYHHKKE
jgi:hypothetical protein